MPQRTRSIIANVMLGITILTIVVFVATHFSMNPPRPSWRNDMVWLGLALAIASRLVRGASRRGAMQG